MPFNIQGWKDDVSTRLQGWKNHLEREGANSVYYFLAATSLLPIVHAAHSGDWGSLAVLGTALGGAVSTNLLANMVQKLKDKTEAEVARELEQEARLSPELILETDALLETLNTLQQAKVALAPDDKLWFEKTIQEELQRINSSVKYKAVLVGNGAIAQGAGAKAVGAGGVMIGGNVDGNFVMGDENAVNSTPKKKK